MYVFADIISGEAQSYITDIVLIAAGLSVVWGVVKIAVPLATLISQYKDTAPTLLVVAHQFRPNGGSSMYDKINEASDNVASLTETIEVFTAQHGELTGEVKRLLGRFEEFAEESRSDRSHLWDHVAVLEAQRRIDESKEN